MNIEAKGYKLDLSLREFWDLAFSVKHSLESTIKTHWVLHQDVWKRNEDKKLILLKDMFNALGRNDVYEGIFIEADKIFKEFNDKKNKQ